MNAAEAIASPETALAKTASRHSALNNGMAWALLAFLALAPLPFGSVHGFAWGFFAAAIGLLAVIYVLTLLILGEKPRVSLVSHAWLIAPFALVWAYLLLQMLPLAGKTISIVPDMTLLMLLRQLNYGLFFYLVLQIAANPVRQRFFARALLMIVLAYAAWALISLQTGDTVLGVPKSAYLGSATGPFVNRNAFATFLAFGAMIALGQLAHRMLVPNKSGNIATTAYAVGYLLLMAVIVATQSRMGLFSALLGSGVVVALLLRAVRIRLGALLLVAAIVAALAGGLLLFGDNILDRLVNTRDAATARTDLYRQVLELIALRPWTGFGGGSFEWAFPLVHRPPLSMQFVWDKAHNSYLTLWSELGLIVGSLPILAFAIIGYRLLRRPTVPASGWTAATTALAVLTVGATHSLMDFSLEIQANTLFFIALIAMGLASPSHAVGGRTAPET